MAVNRSVYYAYLKRQRLPPLASAEPHAARVKECFYRHRRRYGVRRLAVELNLGRHLTRRLMREQNLQAIQPKRFVPKTTNAQPGSRISPNLLRESQRERPQPGQTIVGDITYLALQSGKFCYLATFQDTYTRRIVGWCVAPAMTAELVVRALQMALRRGLIGLNALVHTDQGSQYVSDKYRQLLSQHGLRQSMSGRGNCYDNAQAESFFARYKAELVEDGVFEDIAQARSETFSYIEGYYNRVRRHSGIGYVSPLEFEKQVTRERQARESAVPSLT